MSPSLRTFFLSLLGGIPKASLVPSWARLGQHAHAPWPFPGGTRGCSFSSCCQASHSLAGAPQLLLPEGGCDGCAHNKAPAETIAQECVRFLTNTVWARTIALDSRPRNTFHSARVRVACLPQPAHISFYAKDLDEGWFFPHPDLRLNVSHASPPFVALLERRGSGQSILPEGFGLVTVFFNI